MKIDDKLLKEGMSYLNKTSQIKPSESSLSNDTIYNLVCLGLETSLTAILFAYNEVIDHGSASSLVRTLKKHKEVPEEWINEARFLNKFNTYCSLDVMPAKIPTDEEAERMIAFGNDLLEFIKKEYTPILN